MTSSERYKKLTRKSSVQKIVIAIIIAFSIYMMWRTENAPLFHHEHLALDIVLVAVSAFCLIFQYTSTRVKRTNRAYRILIWVTGVYLSFFVSYTTLLFLMDMAGLILKACGVIQTLNDVPMAALPTAIVLTVYGAVHAFRLKTTYYTLSTSLEKRVRIVQLSDLHMGSIIRPLYLEKVVARVNELQPDLIVITGDLFNHGYVEECADADADADVLATLRSTYGTYAVCGNHDPGPDDPAYQAFLKRAHITAADNQCFEVAGLQLIGRTALYNDLEERRPLAAFYPQPAGYTVILDHDPRGITEAEKYNAGLVLSGHTHDGQFFPTNLVVRLAFRHGKSYGYSRHENTDLIVSSGTGFFQIPVRTFTKSEVVVVDLIEKHA